MKTILTTALLALFALGITGCNTTRGLGQDIEATGETIEDVATDAKDRLSDND